MPYTTVPLTTAETLVKNFDSLNLEIEALSKDKKNKDKVKALTKDLETKGKRIDKVLVDIIAETRKEFNKHALNVEGLLKDAVIKAKAIKGLVAEFEKTGSGEGYSDAMKLRDEIGRYAKEAAADGEAFGASWFKLRGTNFTSQGLTEEYNKNFYKVRYALMGDAKAVVTKISQIAELHEKAILDVNQLSAAFASDGPQNEEVIEEDCQALVEKITKAYNDWNTDGKTNPESNQRSVDSLRKVFEAKPDDALVANTKSRVQDFVAIHKQITGEQKVLQKAIDTQRKLIKEPTPKVEQMLNRCQEMVDAYTGFAKAVGDGAKLNAALLNEMVATLEKKKKKK